MKGTLNQQGFVLVTALIMLSLLTLMSLAMFFSGRSATQTSAAAQSSTEAYYYAETAINYINWAFHNDADFDNFPYTSGSYRHLAFGDPTPPASDTAGDMSEMNAYLSDPGPTAISDASAGLAGQIMYFDNTPLANRALCFYSEADPGAGVALTYPNCINVQLAPNDSRLTNAQPTMFNISVNLPRYIKLEISDTGVVTSSIPQLPHRGPSSSPTAGPVVGEDIPNNGAVVWLTAAGKNSAGTYPDIDTDIEIFPLNEPVSPATFADVCTAASCPCTGVPTVNTRACDANSGLWLDGQYVDHDANPSTPNVWDPPYRVAAYAIGYVNGVPTHLIRAIIY